MVLPKLDELSGQTRDLFQSVGEGARLYSAEHDEPAGYITVSAQNYALIKEVHDSRPGTGDAVRCLQLIVEVDDRLDNETFRLEDFDRKKPGWYKNPLESWT